MIAVPSKSEPFCKLGSLLPCWLCVGATTASVSVLGWCLEPSVLSPTSRGRHVKTELSLPRPWAERVPSQGLGGGWSEGGASMRTPFAPWR